MVIITIQSVAFPQVIVHQLGYPRNVFVQSFVYFIACFAFFNDNMILLLHKFLLYSVAVADVVVFAVIIVDIRLRYSCPQKVI